MNFRLIALASCVALGSIAFGGKAQAQSVDVLFGGPVTNVCVFGTPTAGVLVSPAGLNAVEGSSGLSGGFGTGTAGRVTVDCPTGGSLTTAVPTLVAAPGAFVPAVLQSVVELGATGAFTSAYIGGPFDTGTWTQPTTPLTVPAGLQTLNVGMVAGISAPGFPPTGAYQYRVTLTATSN